MRRVGIGLGVLVLLVVAVGVAGFFLIGRVNLAGFVAGRASAALGRAVTVGEAHLVPGTWSRVELSGVSVANKAGGSMPAMATVGLVSAEVRTMSLLRGPMEVRGASVADVAVLLEHVADGSPNWRDGPPNAGATGARAKFPSLREVTIKGLQVIFVTRGGTRLTTVVDQAVLASAADDQPVSLRMAGSYVGQPVTVEADLQSIEAYRRAAVPFPTVVRMASGPMTLTFDGTMTQPLNVDGAEGRLVLNTPALTRLIAFGGATDEVKPGLRLDGKFRHSGGLWWLWDATGKLADAEIGSASLRLIEGEVPKPDRVSVAVGFETLDLDAMLGAEDKGKKSNADMSLALDQAPSTLIDAAVTAKRLTYDELAARDVSITGALESGKVAVPALSLEAFGTRIRASGAVVNEGGKGHVTAEVSVPGADVQAMRRAFGMGNVPVTGRMEGLFVADAVAPTLNAATRTAHVSGLVAMRGGTIAKSVMEKASLDVASLLRKAEGASAIRCMLLGVDMRDGVGTIAPMRLRSADGAISGYGRFDLKRKVIDLSFATDAATTGALALDVPIRVSGPFADPSVAPAAWSAEGRAALAAGDNVGRLPRALQAMARKDACGR